MTTTTTPIAASTAHLCRGGTSLLARLDDQSLPSILHWGAELAADDEQQLLLALAGAVGDSLIYAQPAVSVLPLHSRGWLGHPGILGSRGGRDWSFDPDTVSHTVEDRPGGPARLMSVATDTVQNLQVTTEIVVEPSGLVRVRASVRNDGEDVYEVTTLEPALPVPASADELLDMTGRHAHERQPQRASFRHGRWAREAWGGRPGHDSATLLCAGETNFGFRKGTVWGVHLAWSGNGTLSAERTTTGWRLLRGGENTLPGEIIVGGGESYSSPWLLGSWGEGLDQLSHRFHDYLRARPAHPTSVRPIILNTWEAVYFDHDLPRLLELADRASALGVERFVLDDGWFTGRRDDTAGLGDWQVDSQVWPNGLGPLADHVHQRGMQFGLWFEPEMINLDSETARSHPDWVLQTPHGPGLPSRQQHVLDLTNPAAYGYILDAMSSLIDLHRIDYLKWDHNRPLVNAGHGSHLTPGVHEQTLAVYRLMDELKLRHPGLEIESCAGGGGRLDLGIMDHADRVWVSDCIDAHERQRMQRWTSLILPPELLGTHIGADQDHTTHRSLDLDYRAGTAIWGHFGIEWDLTSADPTQLARLEEWIALHKELRTLLHTGTVVHADSTNPAIQLEGVVAKDGGDALYRMSTIDHSTDWPHGRITLPGLDSTRRYLVSVQAPSQDSIRRHPSPAWVQTSVTLTGESLATVGLAAPTTDVDQLVLIRAQAVTE